MKVGALEFSAEYVQPLSEAENLDDSYFLQVLLNRFTLTRLTQSRGSLLQIRLMDELPAIWNRQAKTHVKDRMEKAHLKPNFASTCEQYQAKVNAFLQDESEDVPSCPNDTFVFRYASGGVLPIIDMEGTEYYCLFYRGIDPIGWNIANGGTESRDELFHPKRAIQRECFEELLIVDFEKRCRYSILKEEQEGELGEGKLFRRIRRFWDGKFQKLYGTRFRDLTHKLLDQPDDLKIASGPDCIHIDRIGPSPPDISSVFLTITTPDYGIEIDQVYTMRIPPSAIFCDGEVNGEKPVNRPVALFERTKLDEWLDSHNEQPATRPLLPRYVFWNAKRYDGNEFEAKIDRFMSTTKKSGCTTEELAYYKSAKERGDHLGLCPVTEQLIRRYKASRGMRAEKSCKVFLSYGREDYERVLRIHEELKARGHEPWIDDQLVIGREWEDEIIERIKNSDCLVLCLSKSIVNRFPESYIRTEMALAKARDCPLFHVILDSDLEPPQELRSTTWLRLDETSDARNYLRLFQAIESGSDPHEEQGS